MAGLFEFVHRFLDRNYPFLRMKGNTMADSKPVSFLKKLGVFLAKAASIELGLGPLLQPFLGSASAQNVPFAAVATGVNDLTQIAQIATMVEAVNQTPGSGAAKLEAARPLVLQILRTSQAFVGKKIADEALAEKGAGDIVTGVVEFMNAIHPDEVQKN
jgi:hypothetical protein